MLKTNSKWPPVANKIKHNHYPPDNQPAGPIPQFGKQGLPGYLQAVREYKILPKEECDTLAKRFQEHNDLQARDTLVTANLRLVVKIASNYQKYWMNNFLDLIQEGNMGLLLAVKKFDPAHGVKFSYYAAMWIRAYIMKYIMDNWRLVKLGTTQQQRKLFYNLKKEQKKLESEGIEPTTDLLAKRLKIEPKDIEEMHMRMNNIDVSLHTPTGNKMNTELMELLPYNGPTTEEVVENREIKELLKQLIAKFSNTLTNREKVIFNDRMINDSPRTLQSIAEQFQLSRERIRQIEIGLNSKLRNNLQQTLCEMV
jgi:RNA polymerase sigma-32 factor